MQRRREPHQTLYRSSWLLETQADWVQSRKCTSKNGSSIKRSIRIMKKKLDPVVTPDSSFRSVLALGRHPGITGPEGYEEGKPVGICFAGLQGLELKLIEIAHAFEQATKVRKLPSFKYKEYCDEIIEQIRFSSSSMNSMMPETHYNTGEVA